MIDFFEGEKKLYFSKTDPYYWQSIAKRTGDKEAIKLAELEKEFHMNEEEKKVLNNKESKKDVTRTNNRREEGKWCK